MYIELVGLKGSGKTTLASKVQNKLEQKGYSCLLYKPVMEKDTAVWRIKKSLLASKLFLGMDFFIFHIAKIKLRNYSVYSWKECYKDIRMYLIFKDHSRNLSNYDFVVWEYQKSFLLRIANWVAKDLVNEDVASGLIQKFTPEQKSVVHLDTPPVESLKRLRYRKKKLESSNLSSRDNFSEIDHCYPVPGVLDLSESSQEAVHKNRYKNQKQLLEIAEESLDVLIINIDGTEPIERNVSELIETLQENLEPEKI